MSSDDYVAEEKGKALLKSYILISHRINSAVKDNHFASSFSANGIPHHDPFSFATVVWNAWQGKSLVYPAVNAVPSITFLSNVKDFSSEKNKVSPLMQDPMSVRFCPCQASLLIFLR